MRINKSIATIAGSALIVPLLASSASAADIQIWSNEKELENGNHLILDADNTGGDIFLQFGNTLGESLSWDSANARFNLSNSLNVEGNISLTGNVEMLAGTTVDGVDVSELGTQSATNAANIATNATNIAGNTTNIATNTTDISALEAEQITQNTNISNNTSNISNNTLDAQTGQDTLKLTGSKTLSGDEVFNTANIENYEILDLTGLNLTGGDEDHFVFNIASVNDIIEDGNKLTIKITSDQVDNIKFTDSDGVIRDTAFEIKDETSYIIEMDPLTGDTLTRIYIDIV